jgi:hypothetical protein
LPPGFASQLAAVNRSPDRRRKRALPYLSLSLWADSEIQSGNNMETTQQNDQTSIYQSNFRAEDGLTNNRSKALYEGVVVPFAAVFTVFLILLGAMAVTH